MTLGISFWLQMVKPSWQRQLSKILLNSESFFFFIYLFSFYEAAVLSVTSAFIIMASTSF